VSVTEVPGAKLNKRELDDPVVAIEPVNVLEVLVNTITELKPAVLEPSVGINRVPDVPVLNPVAE
jgi:glycyl-tRNA synthetase (class II)